MNVRLVQEAEEEFLAGIAYYHAARRGFGQRFKEEIVQALRRIAEFPETCSPRPGGYRRFNLRVFPYYLPYVVKGQTIWVLAIAHNLRRPEYWIQRRRRL